MSPRTLYRRLAQAELVTWALLLVGMALKYVTRTTELGVSVFGMVHGVVFIAFALATVVVGINQRWSLKELALGLAAAVPPFLTLWFDRRQERRGRLEGGWRLGHTEAHPEGALERVLHTLMARPAVAVAVGLVAVAGLTGLALLVGPPVGQQG